MVRGTSKVLKEARKLPPIERAELIEGLLDSFKMERRKDLFLLPVISRWISCHSMVALLISQLLHA